MKKIIKDRNIDTQESNNRRDIIKAAKGKRTMLSGIYGIESEKISQIIEKHKTDLLAIDKIVSDYEKTNKDTATNPKQVKLDLYNLLMKEEDLNIF